MYGIGKRRREEREKRGDEEMRGIEMEKRGIEMERKKRERNGVARAKRRPTFKQYSSETKVKFNRDHKFISLMIEKIYYLSSINITQS